MERGETLGAAARGFERVQHRCDGGGRARAPEREENALSQRLVVGLQQIGERRDHPPVRKVAQRIDRMVAYRRVGRPGERGQDDAQGLPRAEAAQRLDAVRADQRGALLRQASRKSRQGLGRAEAAQRFVDCLPDASVRLRQRQAIEQRLDGLRLASEAERMRGLLPNCGALEGKRLNQSFERHGTVLPAVGRSRARRLDEQDQGERKGARQTKLSPGHALSISENQ